MAYAPLTKIPQQFFDNLGNPLVSGTLYAYLAGTSTPTNMFSDNAGTVAGTSVVLDSRGEPTTFKLIWLNTAVIYKFVLKDSTGTTIWTIDNISGDDGTGNTASSVFDQQTLTATAGQTLFNLGYEYVTGTNAMAVYKNGSRLITGTDFTETSSTSVTLTMAAIAGDEYTFIGGQDVSSSFSSSNVSFIQSGTGAVTRSVQTKLRETVSAKDFGAVADFATNNTSAVQAALNALPSYGGTVYIADGAKFNLRSLTFPARFNLEYRQDDDLSQTQLPGPTRASGERVLFSSNSSYPADPTGGVVNEWRLTGPFHPGLIVDVRKDLGSKIASYLGPGQSATNPVRASWNISDEQTDVFRVVYENYQATSNFSGVFIHGWKRVVRLNGIGTAQYVSVPAAGITITGTTSGAKGFVLTVAAGYTDVLWFSGEFVVGETISDNNETTSATITSVTYSQSANAWIAQDLKTGAWTVGDRPPGAGTEILNISGNAKVVPTRGGGSNVPKSVINPGYVWGDDPEGAANQIGIIYPTTGSAALRRLQAVRQDLTTWTGAIVPVNVMVNLVSSLAIDTHSVNVSSITKTATGKYTVTFTNSLARAYPTYSLALDGFYMQNWWAGVTFQAVGSCQVWVKDNTGAFADIPAGAVVGLTAMGADI